nr:hypothetical protein [uncultured Brumimicrobium sp.]
MGLDQTLYGSSRIGQEQIGENIASSDLNLVNINTATQNIIGDKYFEMSNHLGNVLEVVSDRKLPVNDGNGNIDYFLADVVSYSDYYPYGMQMPGRKQLRELDGNGNPVYVPANGSDGYRYGYQGSEMDNSIKGQGNSYTTHFRQLDPRVGRWLSIDPKANELPWQSPYCSMDNNPIFYNDIFGDIVEPTGTKKEVRKIKRIIRKGKRKSKTFKEQYDLLDDSDQLHQVKLGDFIDKDGKNQGSNMVVEDHQLVNNEDGASTVMFLNLEKIENSELFKRGGSYSKLEKQIITVGHEMGHQVMKDQGIVYKWKPSPFPTMSNPNFGLNDKRSRVANPAYSEEGNKRILIKNINSTKIFNELGASLRENMIRSDLGKPFREIYKVDLIIDPQKPNRVNYDIPVLLFQKLLFNVK